MHWKYSNDTGEKKKNLLHFYGFSGLIELILLGKAKLSMASCVSIFLVQGKIMSQLELNNMSGC